MIRSLLSLLIFLAGLAATAWVGAGYVDSNPLALAMTALIGVIYLAGALELWCQQRDTRALQRGLSSLSANPPSLASWLDTLPASLRAAVRLRVEGERAALPGPALTPYLAGLLVLLGMLGTFLGMVATLRGTGLALESATDLQALRASLAAPVKGLGFAFGTSVAGVATSAMLGLLSALVRRERLHAGRQLDHTAATVLRAHSPVHQRDAVFQLMQRQADSLPVLIEHMQTMMAAMERQHQDITTRLAASQESFHGKTEEAYTRLARTVEQTLQTSAADSARAAGAAIEPAVTSTMASLAQGADIWRETVAQAVQQQLDGLSQQLERNTDTIATRWQQALAEQQHNNAAQTAQLRDALDSFGGTFAQRSEGLVEQVTNHVGTLSRQLDETSAATVESWRQALTAQQQTDAAQTAVLRDALEGVTASLGQRSADLLDSIAARLEDSTSRMAETWRQSLVQQEQAQQVMLQANQQGLTAATDLFAQHADAHLQAVRASHTTLQAELAERDTQRLQSWSTSLQGVADTLHAQWEQTGSLATSQQQAICATLSETARDITEQTRQQASQTMAEITRLLQASAEAPKAAADVIAELRQQLSDSMARDNAVLEERSRLLETLETLLQGVNHASTEQRAAIDALVGTASDLLAQASTTFSDRMAAQTDRLSVAADQIHDSAGGITSLGEAFGNAVQQFGQSNDNLAAHLGRVEAALDKSMARSDEQLAYYVAQAREVIDLSMLSQRQILDDLRQLNSLRGTGDGAA